MRPAHKSVTDHQNQNDQSWSFSPYLAQQEQSLLLAFPFGSLPLELRLEIIESVIPGYTLPERIRANGIIVI
jgi:hypothetical protein